MVLTLAGPPVLDEAVHADAHGTFRLFRARRP